MECNEENKIKLIDSNQLQMRVLMYMLRSSDRINSKELHFARIHCSFIRPVWGSSALFVMGILYLGSGTGKSRKSFTFMDIPQCHAFGRNRPLWAALIMRPACAVYSRVSSSMAIVRGAD